MTGPRSDSGRDGGWGDGEPDPVPWRSGDWALEVRGGSLSGLTWRQNPVLRAVRFVARDRDWRTAELVDVTTSTTGQGLLVRGEQRSERPGEDVRIPFELTVAADAGTLSVDLVASVSTEFERNRFGLVVLHRPDDAGSPLSVVHPDGSQTSTAFPVDVAPHQPALEVAALAWTRPGVDVTVEFAGDVFEVEDQRNWTDASFKTYSTPLSEPFPMLLTPGGPVRQRVVVRATSGGGARSEAPAVAPLGLRPTGSPVPQFLLGASTAPGGPPAGLPTVDVLVEPVLTDGRWRTVLDRAVQDAAGGRLDVRCVTDDPASLPAALDVLVGLPVVRLGVFSSRSHVTEPELWRALRDGVAARPALAGVDLVAGTRAHFTELNRTLDRLPDDAHAVTFSSTPQMHDTGRDQVLESLPVQRTTVSQALRVTGRAVHVGPVTLRPRFNAVATTERPLPGSDDPRQSSAPFAAWLVASAAEFCVPGVGSVAFAEVWGPRGLRDADGTEFPAAAAFAQLARSSGSELLEVTGTLPPFVHVLAARGPAQDVVLVANVGDRDVVVDVPGHGEVVVPAESVERVLGVSRS